MRALLFVMGLVAVPMAVIALSNVAKGQSDQRQARTPAEDVEHEGSAETTASEEPGGGERVVEEAIDTAAIAVVAVNDAVEPDGDLAIVTIVRDGKRPEDPKEKLKHFPPAAKGAKQHALILEPREDEGQYRVELIIGRTMRTDGINVPSFEDRNGKRPRIDSKHTPNLAYRYYFLEPGAMDVVFITEIGGPFDWKDRFVTINDWGGDPLFLPYDSKTPIVVYLPTDAEVRYRIWRAESEMKSFDAE